MKHKALPALALLALIAVGGQCQKQAPPPPPPPPGAGTAVSINDTAIPVKILSTYADRRHAVQKHGSFKDGTGLLLAYPYPRLHSLFLYDSGPTHRTFLVAFVERSGRIADLQTLINEKRGITSKAETHYVLISDAQTMLKAKAETGAMVNLDALPAFKPEPMPAVTIGDVTVHAELSTTSGERMRGLMGRTAISKNDGMLFAYSSEDDRSFWMADCYMDLSIAFITADGTIATIHHDMMRYPDPPNVQDDDPRYPSRVPVQYALEVNRGFLKEHGIREGMKVTLPPELATFKPDW